MHYLIKILKFYMKNLYFCMEDISCVYAICIYCCKILNYYSNELVT
jgi:hypothetical protein